MVEVEKVWEDDVRIVFCLNDSYLYEYPKKVDEPEAVVLSNVHNSWTEFVNLNPPF